MAKKKKKRRLNIARKRAKRQQNQKSKRKQLALQKQRALQTAKSDEELLQDKIMSSELLLDEPEFENLTFDQDLLRQKTMEALASDLFTLEYEEGEEPPPGDEEVHEHISDIFRFEVLPHLITAEFLNAVSHALRASETRLKRIGEREKAEVALVARSLFELAEPETLAFHPLVFKICARTLEQILAASQPAPDAHDTIEGVLSDVLKGSQSEETDDKLALSTTPDNEEGVGNLVDTPLAILEPEVEPETESEFVPPTPEILPEVLRAKALYKNANGLEIRKAIEVGNGYQVVQDTDVQIELVHTDGQPYITLTADRLLLQCSSKELLDIAMSEVERLCDDALFYLARTVDEA